MKTPRPLHRLSFICTISSYIVLWMIQPGAFSYAQLRHYHRADSMALAHEILSPGIPIALMIGGVVASQEDVRKPVQQWIPDWLHRQYTWEDYVQHSAYLFWGITLVESGATPRLAARQGLYLLCITAANALVTAGLKTTFHTRRPNGGLYAFPSGHTSHAFATATAFYLLTYPKYPFLRYVSFALASSVAIGRVVHNRHWVGDVLFGAGLGMMIPIVLDHYLFPLRCHSSPSGTNTVSFVAYPNGLGVRFGL